MRVASCWESRDDDVQHNTDLLVVKYRESLHVLSAGVEQVDGRLVDLLVGLGRRTVVDDGGVIGERRDRRETHAFEVVVRAARQRTVSLTLSIADPHRRTANSARCGLLLQTPWRGVVWVCLSVRLSRDPAKTDEPIGMSFRIQTRVGQESHALHEGPDRPQITAA